MWGCPRSARTADLVTGGAGGESRAPRLRKQWSSSLSDGVVTVVPRPLLVIVLVRRRPGGPRPRRLSGCSRPLPCRGGCVAACRGETSRHTRAPARLTLFP